MRRIRKSKGRDHLDFSNMEIEVHATGGVAESARIEKCGTTTSCRNIDCEEDFSRTYGICVKIRPVRRSCSQPSRLRRTIEETIMEEPQLEKEESVKDAEQDSAIGIGNNHSLKSEDNSVSLSLDATPTTQEESDLTCDLSAFSSIIEQKNDLFDQLVSHFDKRDKNDTLSTNTNRGRSRIKQIPTRSSSFHPTRRRIYSSQHTVARLKQKNNIGSTDYLNVPTSKSVGYKRQTSTPESSSTNLEESSNSNLGISRIRALSTSSVETSNNDEELNNILTSDSAVTSSDLLEVSSSVIIHSALPKRFNNELYRQKSNSCQTLDKPSKNRKSAPVFLNSSSTNMLRSHPTHRSMTPDITSQRGRAFCFSPTPNGLLSPSDSRGSLDRMTADTIDRRRVRKRASDKFNDTIQSVGQLSERGSSFSSLPLRSRSVIGNISQDSDQWSTSSLHGVEPARDKPKEWSEPTGFYLDKNGRVRQTKDHRNNNNPPPSLPPDWLRERDVTTCSVGSSNNERLVPSDVENSDVAPRPHTPDLVQNTQSNEATMQTSQHESSGRQSALDIALHEDHDSIMRLAKIREDEFTMKLISAMRELKDIADVARIIDEVDDEEWLLVFIGELDHRLHYLMKAEEEEEEKPEDHEANIREKATILDVALDLISFLKDRSAYRVHRSSLALRTSGLDDDEIIGDGNTTIQRMKQMAANKPHNPYDMQRWQRQLMNLAGTLDKYLSLLQKEKEGRLEVAINENDDQQDAQQYIDALSEFSTDPSVSHPSHTSSGASIGSAGFDTGNLRPNFNSNNNNNNNNNNTNAGDANVRRLPVLDLRDTSANTILNHIGQAAYVQDGRNILSPNSIDGERFLSGNSVENLHRYPSQEEEISHPGFNHNQHARDSRSLPASSRTSPSKAVVSAYCRLDTDARRRSKSISNVSDLNGARHVSQLRINVGSTQGRGRNTNTSSARRARSVEARQNKFSQPSNDESERKIIATVQKPNTGARPKVRQVVTQPKPRQRSNQPFRHNSSTHSESSSCSDMDTPRGLRTRHQRLVTSSAGTQCDFDSGARQREKNAEDKLKQMKRKADLLKTGLDEARQERDEKDRKISVLQARLDRMKKNLVTGESEKGAVEEEMDRLKKLLKEKSEESDEEIAILKKRLEELEKKLEKERERYERMSGTVEDLQRQLIASQQKYEAIADGKAELEQRIHDLTLALMHERQHNKRLQEENTRLEDELNSANHKLEENAEEGQRSKQELQTLNDELEGKLAQQRNLEKKASHDKFAAEEKSAELETELEQAENKIEKLEEENQKLNDQVEYLNHELKVNKEMKEAQADQYDKEISRLLSEGERKSADDTNSRQVKREKDRARELEEENERLRNECDEIRRKKESKSSETSTEEKSVQAEDTSYMRMRAFDWYSSEARRDALRLTERGRQLDLETRRRMKIARDAMHQVNCSLRKENNEIGTKKNHSPQKR
ncbi:uncharacterized protein LOC120333398 isoform X2 [Styela clava]